MRAKSAEVRVAKVSPVTDGLRWNEKPVVRYYHKTAAKSGAEILLECDGSPLLVTGRYGKGKVAIFAGTYLGVPAQAEVFLYQWSDYPTLLSRVVQWLVNDPR